VQFIGKIDPDVKIPFIAAEEDCGPIVKALIQEQAGKNLVGYREWLTMREFAETFSQATGMEAEAIMVPEGDQRLPIPPELKTQLDDNYSYWNEFGLEGRDDPTVIHPREVYLDQLPISTAFN
jgi:hypothetical protein